MAEPNTTKTKKSKSSLIGSQAKPIALDSTTKIDIDVNKEFIDALIESGLNNKLDISAIEEFTTISNNRDQIYQLIDTMSSDASVAAILRTYAELVCEPADSGHIVWCESDNPSISKFINYLLNVMNIDKNIFGWVYCLLKYGDVYLRLFRESDYQDELFKTDKIETAYSARNVLNESLDKTLDENVILNIHSANDPYSYYIEMVADPGTMFELTKYGKTFGYIETPNMPSSMTVTNMNGDFSISSSVLTNNYKLKSDDVNVYQADDFVHACLEDNYTRFPEKVNLFTTDADYTSETNAHSYNVRRGKSLLYDSYKVWREKSLLENAALMNRITRSSLITKVGVEVGDMPKEQVKQTLRKVKELFEQKTAINPDTGMAEYTNPGPIQNFVYTATHNGQGAISVEPIGGDVNVRDLADLEWWNNKFYSNYGIPKQFFGWTEDAAGFNGGSSLTVLSSVCAKGIKRVQNAIVQAITDAINLILINKGCKSYLNNFVIKMKAPLTQEEKDYREDLSNRIQAISSMQSLFADVEDRARKLAILKDLIGTLNYGDNIMQELQKEIEAAEEEKRKANEQAAKEANAAENATTSASTTASADINAIDTNVIEEPEAEEAAELDLDLGSAAEVPANNESFAPDLNNMPLVESENFFIDANDNLPTPEELNKRKDFSENI